MSKIYKVFHIFVAVAFLTVSTGIPSDAQEAFGIALPAPGNMVNVSPAYVPAHLIGLQIDPRNPFHLDFLISTGQESPKAMADSQEYLKMVKYFLASLTVPNNDQWVNLSPYESQRIISEELGRTEMGRDLLAQDYLLKQLTASLIYPEKAIGQKFWKEIYAQVSAKYGPEAKIPVNTFNKIWIMPESAVLYEKGNQVWIVKSSMNVMLESDYLSSLKHRASNLSEIGLKAQDTGLSSQATDIIRNIIVPVIKREVNHGQNFALLRQMYNAMVLATWYKLELKQSILAKVYGDANKIKGINLRDSSAVEKIYGQYLKAYKKGVFNYIKEDVDPISQEIIPRKYFSGGFDDSAMFSILKAYRGSDIYGKTSLEDRALFNRDVARVVKVPTLFKSVALAALVGAALMAPTSAHAYQSSKLGPSAYLLQVSQSVVPISKSDRTYIYHLERIIYPLAVNGHYHEIIAKNNLANPVLERDVRIFQRTYHLPTTGQLDARTKNKIDLIESKPPLSHLFSIFSGHHPGSGAGAAPPGPPPPKARPFQWNSPKFSFNNFVVQVFGRHNGPAANAGPVGPPMVIIPPGARVQVAQGVDHNLGKSISVEDAKTVKASVVIPDIEKVQSLPGNHQLDVSNIKANWDKVFVSGKIGWREEAAIMGLQLKYHKKVTGGLDNETEALIAQLRASAAPTASAGGGEPPPPPPVAAYVEPRAGAPAAPAPAAQVGGAAAPAVATPAPAAPAPEPTASATPIEPVAVIGDLTDHQKAVLIKAGLIDDKNEVLSNFLDDNGGPISVDIFLKDLGDLPEGEVSGFKDLYNKIVKAVSFDSFINYLEEVNMVENIDGQLFVNPTMFYGEDKKPISAQKFHEYVPKLTVQQSDKIYQYVLKLVPPPATPAPDGPPPAAAPGPAKAQGVPFPFLIENPIIQALGNTGVPSLEEDAVTSANDWYDLIKRVIASSLGIEQLSITDPDIKYLVSKGYVVVDGFPMTIDALNSPWSAKSHKVVVNLPHFRQDIIKYLPATQAVPIKPRTEILEGLFIKNSRADSIKAGYTNDKNEVLRAFIDETGRIPLKEFQKHFPDLTPEKSANLYKNFADAVEKPYIDAAIEDHFLNANGEILPAFFIDGDSNKGAIPLSEFEKGQALSKLPSYHVAWFYQRFANALKPAPAAGRPDSAQITNGGINFDAAQLSMQIKRDGQGMPLPINLQDQDLLNLQGLFPILLSIQLMSPSEVPHL
jgi:hypothetical protein